MMWGRANLCSHNDCYSRFPSQRSPPRSFIAASSPRRCRLHPPSSASPALYSTRHPRFPRFILGYSAGSFHICIDFQRIRSYAGLSVCHHSADLHKGGLMRGRGMHSGRAALLPRMSLRTYCIGTLRSGSRSYTFSPTTARDTKPTCT